MTNICYVARKSSLIYGKLKAVVAFPQPTPHFSTLTS